MKINFIFLMIAIFISVISKVFQFVFHSKIGDIIVLFATPFFVLAVAFSIESFIKIWSNNELRSMGVLMLVFCCIIILSFQIMMMLVLNEKHIGFIMLAPLITCIILLVKLIT